MKGWYGDRYKHCLASHGIKIEGISKKWHSRVDYYEANPDLVFFDFWKANMENDYSNFNFQEAYEMFRPVVEDKLAQFGQRGFERWYEQIDDFYAISMSDELEKMNIKPEELYSEEWKKQIYQFYEEENLRDAQCSDTLELIEQWEGMIKEIDNPPKDLQGRIILMDKLMHMTHESGDMFNLEYLRKEFDRWYTGVRRFR